ncbi:MAG TPA: TetR family transcriptional regulator [Rhizomicrobium sp.]|nr:TetR family transcriptional regulator [Rhizomicrobium sp.]
MLQPGARSAGKDNFATPRAPRLSALLEAAAQEFNARGIAGASLSRIAHELGLTRAALYYYVKDRGDLAAQCYQQTCDVMRGDLAAADASSGTGLERVLYFLRLSLDPERTPPAVLSEMDYLEGKTHTAIAAAHGRNVEALRALIRGGIADRSIRPCDDEIIAQTLIGTITWIPISVDWVDATDATYRARTVDALTDMIANGQCSNPDTPYQPPVSIDAFFPVAPKAFDREGNAAAKVEQLLMTASQLFNRRGIDGVSLDDITAELGATKGALYHYLDNKTDLVVRCYRRSFDLTERFADAAERVCSAGLERGMTGLYLNVQAHASGLSPLTLTVGVSALPAAVKREITRRARALQRRFEDFGKQGLAEGTYRNIDIGVVAQLGAGAFEWLPKWFSPSDPRASGALAAEIVTLFIRGLRTGFA